MENRIAKHFASSFKQREAQKEYIESKVFLIGDLHNHCSISYGHGMLDDAILFASQQLDFFSITGHFAWPDVSIDKRMEIPKDVVEYHVKGFEKLVKEWPRYKEKMIHSQDNGIIPFYSYEYHGFITGDYTVVIKELDGEATKLPLPTAESTDLVNKLKNSNTTHSYLFIPHHIGYKSGYRGISWDHYNEEKSPIVEIISMHGCAESLDTPFPYLHTMGPIIGSNTMMGGIQKGHHFGVIGSTDHHNASPGSYMSGRAGLWAHEKNRDEIWKALNTKQTCALSGDPIQGILFVSDTSDEEYCSIDAYVSALDTLKTVELIENNRVIERIFPIDIPIEEAHKVEGFISCAFGWGEQGALCNWDVTITLKDAFVLNSSPRLRGNDIVDPLLIPKESLQVPLFSRDDHGVKMSFTTMGNSGNRGDKTQGCVLEIDGTRESRITISIEATMKKGKIIREYSYYVSQILDDTVSEYIDGFVSPVVYIKQFVPLKKTLGEIHISRKRILGSSYYLRAFQQNGDVLYTSPVWIES